MGFSGDRTVIIPTPGGRGQIDYGQDRPARTVESVMAIEEISSLSSGLNLIENAAFEILAMLPSIRNYETQLSAENLKLKLIELIKSFEKKAYEANVDSKEVEVAGYLLCATADEFVLNTPLGAKNNWSRHSLLSYFHAETWGGENFFVILGNLEKNPRKNIDLLELIYICLALGFEGKYAIEPDRASKLLELKNGLYRTITQIRGAIPKPVSIHWKGEEVVAEKIRNTLPLWVLAIFLLALLCVVYFYLLIRVNDQSSYSLLNASRTLTEQHGNFQVQVSEVNESVLVRVNRLLEQEVERRLVSLNDRQNQIRIVINTDQLFRSGSADVEPDYAALLNHIGIALMDVEGRIIVEGHTDSIPINTLRFPSNWHLSQARAEQVKSLLERAGNEQGRYSIDAKADTQPVAGNDTAEGRAQNRRVELVLLPNSEWR
ncbi:Outer membrane protein ImpK/VasF, OmpA/MotB domain [Nitrincola lacisaponensis]|uniref:Outer membrane protein ImpK/VasF, OmpA/MotB domain n=1 Tax=Nitrincola lacisaponensis TaxID=267850 RepID=A0A063Y5C1_9GAMM|nr:type VI secretion system protein TssL, long form [Nitrincola lacisaponensis]KDE40879.1 Outer membrane protein ImpK/VasF, OmpA/MotB domain [Nitrincola lacisaponensis]